MSANIPVMAQSISPQSISAEEAGLSHQSLLATMRKQRIQDFLFHKVTLVFSLLVLAVLLGIIV